METLPGGYRPKTTRNYRSKSNVYYKYCQLHRLPPYPVTEWNMIRFTRYIANGVTSYETVKAYVSAIKTCHNLSGIPFPTDVSMLRHHLRALKKELAMPVKKATPMTPEWLIKMYTKVDKQSMKEITCYAGLVVGFTLFLRKSNLVPDTQATFNPQEQLTRGHVGTLGMVTVVNITWHKSNQYRKRDLLLPVIPSKHQQICAEFWIKYLITMVPGQDTDALLSYCSKGAVVPVTYDLLAGKLKSGSS